MEGSSCNLGFAVQFLAVVMFYVPVHIVMRFLKCSGTGFEDRQDGRPTGAEELVVGGGVGNFTE